MILSISEAARKVGIARSNLYVLKDKGRISFTKQPDGKAGIDLSELDRVFPKKTSRMRLVLTNEDIPKRTLSEREVYLEEKVAFLEKQLALEQERVTSLIALSKNHSEQLLLTHQKNNHRQQTLWERLTGVSMRTLE
jgi:hypothetical protein